LDSHISGADKKFALEIQVRNWTDGNGRGFYCTGDTVGADDAFNSLINTTTNDVKFGYDGPTGAFGRTISTQVVTSAATKIRIEYDGSIDTDHVDRVKFYFDDVLDTTLQEQPSIDFPFDIDSLTREFAFGLVRSPNGTVITGSGFNGEAKNLVVQEDVGAGWIDVINVATISSGVDSSGNNYNGTWIS
jgi:hypothetical protein